MLLTYAVVAFNIAGSIAVVLLTWGSIRGIRADREMKIQAQPSVSASK